MPTTAPRMTVRKMAMARAMLDFLDLRLVLTMVGILSLTGAALAGVMGALGVSFFLLTEWPERGRFSMFKVLINGDLAPRKDLALLSFDSSFLAFLSSFLAATGFSGAMTEPRASKLSNSKVSRLSLPSGPEGSLRGILEAFLMLFTGRLTGRTEAGRGW